VTEAYERNRDGRSTKPTPDDILMHGDHTPKEWWRRKSRRQIEEAAFLDEDVSLAGISAYLRRRKPGPFKKLVLWASGADLDILRIAPVERTELVVQGSGVFIAASMAFVSAFLLGGILLERPLGLLPRLLIASFFSLLVLTFDRSIVSQQLAPYRFSPEVLNSIYDPRADLKWYDVLVKGVGSGGGFARFRSHVALPFKVGIRFAFSFVASLIIADVIVILMVLPTVDQQAQIDLGAQKDTAIALAQKNYQQDLTGIQTKEDALKPPASQDPNVNLLATRLNQLNSENKIQTQDLEKLQAYVRAEKDGQKGYTYVLSDGSRPPHGTTGQPGCVRECHEAEDAASQKQIQIDKTQSQISQTQVALDGALKNASSTDQRAYNAYLAEKQTISDQRTEAKKREDTAVANANSLPDKVHGILIRRAALHQLVNSQTPWNTVNETNTSAQPVSASCASNWIGFVCRSWRSFFPNTPLGTFVGSVRVLLIIVDMSAVIFKLMASMRRRRPYDAMVAAIEEAQTAEVVNRLDKALDLSGRIREERAALRHSARAGDGVLHLRQVREMSERSRRRLMKEVREQVEAELELKKRMPKGWQLLRAWRRPVPDGGELNQEDESSIRDFIPPDQRK
jgi:hypothetical protein